MIEVAPATVHHHGKAGESTEQRHYVVSHYYTFQGLGLRTWVLPVAGVHHRAQLGRNDAWNNRPFVVPPGKLLRIVMREFKVGAQD